MDEDYYEILGVDADASEREIREAYHRLARRYHPDRNPSPGADARFKQIAEAYAVLGDPESRARYGEQWSPRPTGRVPAGGLHLHLDLGILRLGLGLGRRAPGQPPADASPPRAGRKARG